MVMYIHSNSLAMYLANTPAALINSLITLPFLLYFSSFSFINRNQSNNSVMSLLSTVMKLSIVPDVNNN